MPTTLPIMPFVILILLLLPVRLSNYQMKGLAFFLWSMGGFILCFRGIGFILGAPEHPSAPMLALIVGVALAIGFGKGKFVLSKTSGKNMERINQFTEPQKPIQVYSVRSWIIIGLMVGISVSLTLFHTPLLWRGGINLAIGFALIISSLAYLKAISPSAAAKQESPTN